MFWTSANLRILPPVLRIGHTLCLVSCAMYRCIRCTPDMGPRHSTHTTGPRMGIGSVSWCWHLNVSETYDHPPILMVYPSVSVEKVPLWGDKFMSLRGICRNPLAIDASWCFTLLNTMVVNGFLLLANVGPQASENRIRKYHKYMGHRCLRCQWKWEEVIRQPGGCPILKRSTVLGVSLPRRSPCYATGFTVEVRGRYGDTTIWSELCCRWFQTSRKNLGKAWRPGFPTLAIHSNLG